MSSTRVFICSGYNGSPSSQPRGSSLSSNTKEMSWYLILVWKLIFGFGCWYFSLEDDIWGWTLIFGFGRWYLELVGRWYLVCSQNWLHLLFWKWFQLLMLGRSFLQRFLFVWLSSDLCLKYQMSLLAFKSNLYMFKPYRSPKLSIWDTFAVDIIQIIQITQSIQI